MFFKSMSPGPWKKYACTFWPPPSFGITFHFLVTVNFTYGRTVPNTAHDQITEGWFIGSGAKNSSLWESPRDKRVVPHWASMLRWIWSISECNLMTDRKTCVIPTADRNTHDPIIEGWSIGRRVKHSSWPDNWRVVYWQRSQKQLMTW